jgi:hypothetical protein
MKRRMNKKDDQEEERKERKWSKSRQCGYYNKIIITIGMNGC